MAILLCLLLLLVFLNIILQILPIIFCHNKYIPRGGPKTYPLIGCSVAFYKNRDRLLDWYTDLLASSPTQTVVVHRLGARRTVLTADPACVEHVLRSNFANYPKGKPFTEILGDLLGSGIFNADGQLWHAQRKLASREFTVRSMREGLITELEAETGGRLLPRLRAASVTGRCVDVQDLLRRFAFDVICQVSLGMDPSCLGGDLSNALLPESELARAFEVASAISARRATAPVAVIWKLKRALGIGTERKLRDAVSLIHSQIMELIRERKAEMEKGGVVEERSSNDDFLTRLISSGQNEELVRDMVISFLMAGRDTTSAGLTWFFWLIARHPAAEREIVDELGRLGGRLDYHSIKEMRVLEACLCESMRLFPPVAWDSKHAAAPDVLPDGTRVEAGDRVTYFPYGMGRMEKIWGEGCGGFDHRRWLEADVNGGSVVARASPYKFPVFQAGPRACLGKEMAMVQMKYVAAAMLLEYELKMVEEKTPVLVPLLTAHMAGGLQMVVRRRKNRSGDASSPIKK
ncbi:cytochrome P450 94B3-like [Zingiber officinale]|uniref:Cytochrome P450 94B3 n=1 Tax=Zingiber officinale TaxID=94328 RepID=A0A8J5KXM0_ZINOF|nr:cytochrome P450 94B3-like [Zingiber officinale]KAG6503093.1 hypothetical protein ZIOFF_035382 [Zingiber officinale]